MSTYYNYQQLHDQFDESGILVHYEAVIRKIAAELDEIAFALKTGGTPNQPTALIEDVSKLRKEITDLESKNIDGKYNTLGIIAL
ncbi:FUSC-like inner membrane protein yccS [compost metagenome]